MLKESKFVEKQNDHCIYEFCYSDYALQTFAQFGAIMVGNIVLFLLDFEVALHEFGWLYTSRRVIFFLHEKLVPQNSDNFF